MKCLKNPGLRTAVPALVLFWAGQTHATVTVTESDSAYSEGLVNVHGVDCSFVSGVWRTSKYKPCEAPSAKVYTTAEVDALIDEAEKRVIARLSEATKASGKADQKVEAASERRAKGLEDRIARLEQSVVDSLDRFDQRVLNDRFIQMLRDEVSSSSFSGNR